MAAVVNGGRSAVVEEEVMVVRVGVGLALVRDAPADAATPADRVGAVIYTEVGFKVTFFIKIE